MSAVRIAAAAPGLRAMLSTAEAVALPCAMPHAPDAMAIAKPEVMATQLAVPMPPPASCANAGGAPANITIPANNQNHFFMHAPFRMNRPAVGGCAPTLLQWRLTLRGTASSLCARLPMVASRMLVAETDI